jgi:hypothetical protein
MAKNLSLFMKARSLWPLDLGLMVYETSPGEFSCNPSLVKLYRQIEDEISPTDEWNKIATWSFHQALWELALKAYREGRGVVYPRDVLRSDFDRMVLDNLTGAEWADMRQEYIINSSRDSF